MIAETTAPIRKKNPLGSIANVRSFLTSNNKIPVKDTIKPVKLSHDNLSLKKNQAATGVNKGIVAIITEVMVDVVYFNP